MKEQSVEEQLSQLIDAWNGGAPGPDRGQDSGVTALARAAWVCRQPLRDLSAVEPSDAVWNSVRSSIGRGSTRPIRRRLLIPAAGLIAAAAMAATTIARHQSTPPVPPQPTLAITTPLANATVSGAVPIRVALTGSTRGSVYRLSIDHKLIATRRLDQPGFVWITNQWPNGKRQLSVDVNTGIHGKHLTRSIQVRVQNLAPRPGTLAGLVLDPTDHGLAGARVLVTGSAHPLRLKTDAAGVFEVASLRSGRYNVTASYPGAIKPRPVSVWITPGQTALARLHLQITSAARPAAPTERPIPCSPYDSAPSHNTAVGSSKLRDKPGTPEGPADNKGKIGRNAPGATAVRSRHRIWANRPA